MKNKVYNIGISCIGSGVGQSVINSLRLSRLPLKTIGFGSNPFAYGAYDCDAYDDTKSIYEADFIDDLLEKCRKHKVDLIIPGLDDEALLYSQNAERFAAAGIRAILAGSELIAICRDKEKMSNVLNNVADVFVKSYDKNTLIEKIENGDISFPLIAKPRDGFASRGLEIIRTRDELAKIRANHVVQELAVPVKDDPNYDYYMREIARNRNPQVSEISIQLVHGPDGKSLGRMFSYNKLKNGVPIEIVPCDNEYVWRIIDQLLPALKKMGLFGPLNIQGRLTEKGLQLFEMNPRFTGITGLRALMGFNEVEACVKEWLDIDKGRNHLRLNYNRFGVRQTADKSIPLERNDKVTGLFKKLKKGALKKKKTLFITGASGYLGRNLIKKLHETHKNKYEIVAFGRDKKKLSTLFSHTNAHLCDKNDLDRGLFSLGNVDILLHLGFTRPHGTNSQIAESMVFTGELLTRAVMNHVPAIINASSQSVYGIDTPAPWTEDIPVSPQTVYAQGKLASECILASVGRINTVLRYCSLRIGTLAGGADGLVEVDFLSKIVKKALRSEPITITGGMQQMQLLDIRDAIDAIALVITEDPGKWKPLYNLGSNRIHRLDEIVKRIIHITTSVYGAKAPEVNICQQQVDMKFGLDSTMFYRDFKWQPKYGMDDAIFSLAEYYKKSESVEFT